MAGCNSQSLVVWQSPDRGRVKDASLLVHVADKPIGNAGHLVPGKDADPRVNLGAIDIEILPLLFSQAATDNHAPSITLSF